MSGFMIGVFVVPAVIMSIILHEISHGYTANLLGDDTAKINRRLSLNPFDHIDLFGTIILPLLLLLATRGGLVFGYAKPVPINPNNFPYETRRRDLAISAAAGPAANIAVAIFFSIIFRLIFALNDIESGVAAGIMFFIAQVSFYIVLFNLVLAVFNLIPMPPLDGSKILGAFLPPDLYVKYIWFERQGMMILMAIIFISFVFRLNIIGAVILPPIRFLMSIFLGI